MKELINEITTFWEEKGLYKNSTALSQCLKLSEEIGEMDRCILDKDWKGLKYEIGDTCIVFINILKILKLESNLEHNISISFYVGEDSVEDCKKNIDFNDIVYNTEQIHESFCGLLAEVRSTKYINCLSHNFVDFYLYLKVHAYLINTTLEECIRLAHNKNKNRLQGRMVGANFIKGDDLND